MIENQQVTLARKIFLKFTAQCQTLALGYCSNLELKIRGGKKFAVTWHRYQILLRQYSLMEVTSLR